jgi:hypothetical protein
MKQTHKRRLSLSLSEASPSLASLRTRGTGGRMRGEAMAPERP